MDWKSIMAVTVGTVMHGVVQTALGQLGVTVPVPDGDCRMCGLPRPPKGSRGGPKYCGEHAAADPETMARCHLDGVLNLLGGCGFEFKTIFPYGLKEVRDMDPETFRAKWPKYWAQVQECMRLSGLRRYVVLFMGIGTPWELREFHVEYDVAHNVAVEAKYRRVLRARAAGVEIRW
jgi:hypothetical protein